MNIILMGYRGSGKTTIGKKIAAQTWKDFADVDAVICQRMGGRTIREIWDTDGEPAFRAVEVQVTRDLVSRADHVIALGGGTVMQPEARQAIIDAPDAKRVYLACNPQVLASRIANDPATAATRPSLSTAGGGLEEIVAVLAERDPVYRQVADVVFDVSHVGIDEAVAYLVRKYL